jgi:hypothetical protein
VTPIVETNFSPGFRRGSCLCVRKPFQIVGVVCQVDIHGAFAEGDTRRERSFAENAPPAAGKEAL